MLVDPVELYHKLVMELVSRSDYAQICRVGCFAYDFEMDGWSTKGGEAKMPVVPDRGPCLNDGFMGLVLPVAERHYCAKNTHRLLLVRS